MGIPILDKVITLLRATGFTAGEAYPGQLFPQLAGPIAVAHLEKAEGRKAAVEVSILCPASAGAVACEERALRALQALQEAGAGCTQGNCRYEGTTQTYIVPITAVFTGENRDGAWIPGPGFQVYLDEQLLTGVISFQSERRRVGEVRYQMGENAPAGLQAGSWVWNIRLEERVPQENRESPGQEGTFLLRLERGGGQEVFKNCLWTQETRELNPEGVHRVRSGICLAREEDALG